MTGKDGKIQWEVTERTTPTIISVFNTDNQYYDKREYTCLHSQEYGFDPEDMYNMNLLLNKMIEKAKEI